jgi:hypothetical protein
MRSFLIPGGLVVVVVEGAARVEDIGGPKGNINNNDVFVP